MNRQKEESTDPLKDAAQEGPEGKREADGLDAMEVLRAGSWTVTERGAQVMQLLREVERQTRMDRVDPRVQLEEQDQLVEQNAEAQRSRKDRRKAGTQEGLLNRPRKGLMNLRDARRRRLVNLRDSPLLVDRPMAELKSRHRLRSGTRKRRKRTTLMRTVRWQDSQEVFGMQWRVGRSRSRSW